jgi:hypothetical protein
MESDNGSPCGALCWKHAVTRRVTGVQVCWWCSYKWDSRVYLQMGQACIHISNYWQIGLLQHVAKQTGWGWSDPYDSDNSSCWQHKDSNRKTKKQTCTWVKSRQRQLLCWVRLLTMTLNRQVQQCLCHYSTSDQMKWSHIL